MRSAYLAEYRAETEALAAELAAHAHIDEPGGPKCKCGDAVRWRAEPRERRRIERAWFDSPPGGCLP